MKKLLLFLFSGALIGNTSFAQIPNGSSVPFTKKLYPFAEQPDVVTPLIYDFLPVQHSDKAENATYIVDYSALNLDDQYVPAGDPFYALFQVNSQAAAIDSLPIRLDVALRPYYGFTDYNDLVNTYYEPEIGAPGAMIRLDSIFVFYAHENNSGNSNKIYISVRGGTTYNFPNTPPVEGPNNTIYWADTITTTTSLSPNGDANGTPNTSGVLYEEAVGIMQPLTSTSGSFVIDVRTNGIAVNDTFNVYGYLKVDGENPVVPYIWNTTTIRSETPASIRLFYASAAMWAVVTYTNTLSIENLEAAGFTIHSLLPNPADESTTISYELKTPADVRFMITDMTGKIVEVIDVNDKNSGTYYHALNTSSYASGIYNVSMVVNNRTFTQKLVVR